jgi:hypothetical protein
MDENAGDEEEKDDKAGEVGEEKEKEKGMQEMGGYGNGGGEEGSVVRREGVMSWRGKGEG